MSLHCHLTLIPPPPSPTVLSIHFVTCSFRKFISRPDQTHTCQNLASVSETSRNASYAFLTFYILKKKNAVIKISETYNVTYFILGTDSYLFRRQSNIFRNLLNTNDCYWSSRYIRWHEICPAVEPNEILLYHILSQMFIQTCTKYKQLWSCAGKDSLLYGVVITTMWTVLVKMCNGDFRFVVMKMKKTEPRSTYWIYGRLLLTLWRLTTTIVVVPHR